MSTSEGKAGRISDIIWESVGINQCLNVNQNDQSAEDWKSGDNFDDNFDDCFGKFNDNAGSQLSTGS